MPISYRCPGCESESNVHDIQCEYQTHNRAIIEKAYIDVISALVTENAIRDSHGIHPGITFSKLTSKVDGNLETGSWTSLHTDVLHDLKKRRIVLEDDDGIFLQKPEERESELIPQYDPMKTVYEHGPIDGCKDYCVYSMVSWCEMQGLDWDQTVEFCTEWLEETGAWERESWGESSIAELLGAKRHVHENGLGWKERAEHAQTVIENSGHEPVLDATAKAADTTEDDT